ncbi:(13S,14R)-1,13-dihydroxy-N-methylcanadine 13-O-acetyltransferase AT1 [Ricinus communis]|nr:(13S,14R)-1,13-dihydroxy-N-methylcanadine 13-O-acetyltransferase AT1 [Ricinus communis]
MEVELEFISNELIKPSSPTPNHLRHLRHLQLSFLDQIQIPVWMPLCNQLKKSLSKTLTLFYPFAGRVRNNTHIDCNDEGALFVEAQANCRLLDFLRMLTLATTTTTLFPPKTLSGFELQNWIKKDKIVTKRFVFDASIIAALRANYTYKYGCSLSRNLQKSDDHLNFLKERAIKVEKGEEEDMVKFEVDMELLEHVSSTSNRNHPFEYMEEKDGGIVSRTREAIRNVNADYVKSDGYLNFLKEGTKKKAEGEVITFSFTSLCRFPTDEIDFGWGKPVWERSPPLPLKNLAVFSDAKAGQEIEAWINLKEEDMSKFEIDKELLAHISSTPNENVFVF